MCGRGISGVPYFACALSCNLVLAEVSQGMFSHQMALTYELTRKQELPGAIGKHPASPSHDLSAFLKILQENDTNCSQGICGPSDLPSHF